MSTLQLSESGMAPIGAILGELERNNPGRYRWVDDADLIPIAELLECGDLPEMAIQFLYTFREDSVFVKRAPLPHKADGRSYKIVFI